MSLSIGLSTSTPLTSSSSSPNLTASSSSSSSSPSPLFLPSSDTTLPPARSLRKRSLKQLNIKLDDESFKKPNLSSSREVPKNDSVVTKTSSASSKSLKISDDDIECEDDDEAIHERQLLASSEWTMDEFLEAFPDDPQEVQSHSSSSPSSKEKTPPKPILKGKNRTPTSSSSSSSSSSMPTMTFPSLSSSSSLGSKPYQRVITFGPDTEKLNGLSQTDSQYAEDATQSLSPFSPDPDPESDQVEIPWENGIYKGQVKKVISEDGQEKQVPHGIGSHFGQIHYKDSNEEWKTRKYTIYRGGWENGLYHVTAGVKIKSEDGTISIRYANPGYLYYNDSPIVKYKGGFVAGQYDGYGESFNKKADPFYFGFWQKGKYHGQGKRFKKLEIYEGQFKEDKREGHGTCIFKVSRFNRGQPRIYTGSYSENMMHGEGEWKELWNGKVILSLVKYVENLGLVIRKYTIDQTTKKKIVIWDSANPGQQKRYIDPWGNESPERPELICKIKKKVSDK